MPQTALVEAEMRVKLHDARDDILGQGSKFGGEGCDEATAVGFFVLLDALLTGKHPGRS